MFEKQTNIKIVSNLLRDVLVALAELGDVEILRVYVSNGESGIEVTRKQFVAAFAGKKVTRIFHGRGGETWEALVAGVRVHAGVYRMDEDQKIEVQL